MLLDEQSQVLRSKFFRMWDVPPGQKFERAFLSSQFRRPTRSSAVSVQEQDESEQCLFEPKVSASLPLCANHFCSSTQTNALGGFLEGTRSH